MMVTKFCSDKKYSSIKDKSGKEIKCPRDSRSRLFYLHTKKSELGNAAMDSDTPTWKNVVGDIDTKTGADK
jgi:hypothetical protein